MNLYISSNELIILNYDSSNSSASSVLNVEIIFLQYLKSCINFISMFDLTLESSFDHILYVFIYK